MFRCRALVVAGLVAVSTLTGLGVAHADPSPSVPAGATFVPVAPKRVLDTRRQCCGPVQAGGAAFVDVTDLVPASATAIVFNLTGTNATANTVVRARPVLAVESESSSLNLGPGEDRANLVTVALGTIIGKREVELSNHVGSVDLIADLAGYYVNDTSGSRYTTQSPQRVLDTREQGGPVGPRGAITLDLSNRLPATATAVTFNLTGTNNTAGTFVTAWPHGTPQPTASNLNLPAWSTRPNLVTVAVGPDRKVDLGNNAGAIDLIVDVAGYYATDQGDPFFSLTPTRTLDTRTTSAIGAGESRTLDLSRWLPASAKAVLYNLTATNPTGATFVTAYPAGTALPNASNLNLVAGQTAPNLAVTALGAGGKLALRNNNGSIDLITDIAGYFGPAPARCTSKCLYAWGTNTYGELGNGTTGGERGTANQVPGLSGVTQVAGGMEGGWALREDGTVWALGHTWQSAGYSPQPKQLPGLSGVTAIADGWKIGLAVKGDGTVWQWGDSLTATQVPGLSNIVSVASGSETRFALRGDGTVWGWGDGTNGALGNGSTASSPTPIQIPVPGGVAAIAAADQSGYALMGDGSLWAWGSNWDGELGVGSDESFISHPVKVSALGGVKKIAASRQNTAFAIKQDGTLWSWGSNLSGILGTGNGSYRSTTPQQVPGLSGVTAIGAGGWSFALALTSDGTVWGWGDNGSGALALDSRASQNTPVRVPGLSGVTVTGLAGGGEHAYALANS